MAFADDDQTKLTDDQITPKKPAGGAGLGGIQPPSDALVGLNPTDHAAADPLGTADPMAFQKADAGKSPFTPAAPIAPIPDAIGGSGFKWVTDAEGHGGYQNASGAGITNADTQGINAQQSNIDRINGANSAYNAGGTWDGTDAGRTTINGINQGGDHWDPTQGKFVAGAPTTTTPGFQVALDGKALDPGQVIPSSGITSTGTFQPGSGTQTAPGAPVVPTGGAATNVSPASGGLPDGASGAGGGAAGAGVNLKNIDPNDALLNKVISPDNTVDRVKLGDSSLQSTIDNVLHPALDAASKDVATRSFGSGRGVSGFNRTAQGNLASDYGHQISDLTNQSHNNALNGSIQDLYNNIGIAQQQQGFQAGQQQNAFNQNAQTTQLQDSLTNSAAGRALAQEQAGYSGSPADISLILSQIFGNQATGAGNAASNLFKQQGANSAGGTTAPSSGSGVDIAGILKRLFGGSGTGNAGATSPTEGSPETPDDGQ